MWAGSRLKFLAPMNIGAQLNKTSTIKAVTQKTGRSGALAFVTVLHQVHDGETLCIEEEHDIVYREKINADAPEVLPPRLLVTRPSVEISTLTQCCCFDIQR